MYTISMYVCRGEGNDHDRHSLALGLLLNDIFVSSWRILPKVCIINIVYILYETCYNIVLAVSVPDFYLCRYSVLTTFTKTGCALVVIRSYRLVSSPLCY